MKKTVSIDRVSGAATYELPADMCREIGRIITHWAYFEYCLQEMNWQTLGITPSAGRVALRAPRASDRLEMLRDLVKLRKGEWDDDLFKSLLERTKLVAAKRDLVAHGIWAHRDDGWYVELSRGAWPKNLRDLVASTKQIDPELKPIDTDKLRAATKEISELIVDLKRLRASAVGPPAPSPRTHR
jgi:hypothetical protein